MDCNLPQVERKRLLLSSLETICHFEKQTGNLTIICFFSWKGSVFKRHKKEIEYMTLKVNTVQPFISVTDQM